MASFVLLVTVLSCSCYRKAVTVQRVPAEALTPKSGPKVLFLHTPSVRFYSVRLLDETGEPFVDLGPDQYTVRDVTPGRHEFFAVASYVDADVVTQESSYSASHATCIGRAEVDVDTSAIYALRVYLGGHRCDRRYNCLKEHCTREWAQCTPHAPVRPPGKVSWHRSHGCQQLELVKATTSDLALLGSYKRVERISSVRYERELDSSDNRRHILYAGRLRATRDDPRWNPMESRVPRTAGWAAIGTEGTVQAFAPPDE